MLRDVVYAVESRSISIFLLTVDYISSRPAMLLPAKELVSVCRRHDVLVFVDGAHTPGQIELNVEDIGADFFAGYRPNYYPFNSNFYKVYLTLEPGGCYRTGSG